MAEKTATNPNGAGRKSKFTDARVAKLLKALREGCTRRAACAVAGIGESTFADWLRLSVDPESGFSGFSEAVTRAEDEAEAGFARTIQQAAKAGDWRAAESWLKRRRRDDWGDNVKQDVNGTLNHNHRTAEEMSDDELGTIAISKP